MIQEPHLGMVATPALILDRGVLEGNLRRMQQKANRMNVALRPHMKTAKSSEVGVLATQGRRDRIAVSTISELEYFAERGFSDILYTVSIVPEKVERIAVA